MNEKQLRIPYAEVYSILLEILLKLGVPSAKAETCATVFATNSLEGVYTHGLNRFPRFAGHIRDGVIRVDADPNLYWESGAIEQWNGNMGIGITNALHATDRAIALAEQHGIGCVGLSFTNHWMRAGTYAKEAADRGYALIAWSNTTANMPAWGSSVAKLGNNPIAFGIPNGEQPIILDLAMTQYSYGALELHRLKGEKLPVPGGFDKHGTLTDDPDEILKSRRPLSIGYWKGTGLSLVLDMFAAVLSSGNPVATIARDTVERGLSQVFLAIRLDGLVNADQIGDTLRMIIDDLKSGPGESESVRIPGEKMIRVSKENLEQGIPVATSIWDETLSFLKP